MIAVIAPVKQIKVNYKINNPIDTGTYYVRAVIKDALTNVTLDTLNLIDDGTKFFSNTWTTPNDPSGSGRQIVIFKTVYTDSGYTTESINYGTEIDNIVVLQPISPYGSFGAGTGGTSYHGPSLREIKELIERLLKERDTNRPTVDLSEIIGEIGGLKNELLARFKGRMAILFKLAERVESFDQIKKVIEENTAASSEVSTKIKRDVAELKSIISELDKTITKAVQSVIDDKGNDLSAKAEEVVDDAGKRLVSVLKVISEEIPKRLDQSIDDTLKQLTEVRLFNFNNAFIKSQGEEKKPKDKKDMRAENLIKHLS